MKWHLSGRINRALHEVRTEVAHEGDARRLLEERVRQLEERPRATDVCGNVEETVDISVVVIGGFAENALQQIEDMVHEMLANVNGLKDVEVAGSNSNIALATFDSSMNAMKFIGSQRKHPVMMSAQFWAAENRSRDGKNRCTVLSKIDKPMIELGDHSAKDVVVSYKSFRVITRVNGKLVPSQVRSAPTPASEPNVRAEAEKRKIYTPKNAKNCTTYKHVSENVDEIITWSRKWGNTAKERVPSGRISRISPDSVPIAEGLVPAKHF